MGGYQLNYEAFETFVMNQARMAKCEREWFKAKKDPFYIGSSEAREAAVFELAKYLGAPEKEVKRIWEEAEK